MSVITIKRGDDRIVRTAVTTQPGGTEPYPWAGSTVWFTAKSSFADEAPIVSLVSTSGATAIDLTTDGIALSKIPGSATRLLPNEITYLRYDVQVRNPDGEIFTVDSGTLIIEPEVTLEPSSTIIRPASRGLLASVEELELFLDDDLNRARAELFLLIASAEARAYTGNEFVFVEGDVIIVNGSGSPTLILPQAPISAIVELTEAPRSSAEKILAGPESSSPAFEWAEEGIVRRLDGGIFARRFRYYRFIVDHGFDVAPDEVRGVVIRCAARAFENPDGVRQESLGRYSYTLAGEQAGIGLYAPDRRDLDPYHLGSKWRAGTAAAGSGS